MICPAAAPKNCSRLWRYDSLPLWSSCYIYTYTHTQICRELADLLLAFPVLSSIHQNKCSPSWTVKRLSSFERTFGTCPESAWEEQLLLTMQKANATPSNSLSTPCQTSIAWNKFQPRSGHAWSHHKLMVNPYILMMGSLRYLSLLSLLLEPICEAGINKLKTMSALL